MRKARINAASKVPGPRSNSTGQQLTVAINAITQVAQAQAASAAQIAQLLQRMDQMMQALQARGGVGGAAAVGAAQVNTWEDDPFSEASPTTDPRVGA